MILNAKAFNHRYDGVGKYLILGETGTSIPERSKGADLRSVAYASWVRTPLLV